MSVDTEKDVVYLMVTHVIPENEYIREHWRVRGCKSSPNHEKIEAVVKPTLDSAIYEICRVLNTPSYDAIIRIENLNEFSPQDKEFIIADAQRKAIETQRIREGQRIALKRKNELREKYKEQTKDIPGAENQASIWDDQEIRIYGVHRWNSYRRENEVCYKDVVYKRRSDGTFNWKKIRERVSERAALKIELDKKQNKKENFRKSIEGVLEELGLPTYQSGVTISETRANVHCLIDVDKAKVLIQELSKAQENVGITTTATNAEDLKQLIELHRKVGLFESKES